MRERSFGPVLRSGRRRGQAVGLRAQRLAVRDGFLMLGGEIVVMALATSAMGAATLRHLVAGRFSPALLLVVTPFTLAALVAVLSFTVHGGWNRRHIPTLARAVPAGLLAGAVSTYGPYSSSTRWQGSALDWAAVAMLILTYFLLSLMLSWSASGTRDTAANVPDKREP